MKIYFILGLSILFSGFRPVQAQKLSTQTLPEMISTFADPDLFKSGRAINQVVSAGGESIPFLYISLFDSSEMIRTGSAIALYKLQPPAETAVPLYIRALQDSSADVRWICTLTLAQYNQEAGSAIPALQKLLNDTDPDIRWAAYVALKNIDKTALTIEHDLKDILNIIETATPALLAEHHVPGAAITLIRGQKIVASRFFGKAGAEIPVSTQTVFEVCSMSKPVFAFLAMDLIGRGGLSLDQPLSDLLPEVMISEQPGYSREITARMILSHTSGLPNWRKSGEERESPLPVYFKPGLKFNYSGEGIFYLQRVLEKITGLPLEIYSGKALFERLGLHSTSFVWNETIAKNLAAGHDDRGYPKKPAQYTTANAAYTLYSTSEEYARFLLEVMSEMKKGQGRPDNVFGSEMADHQVRVEVRETINRPGKNLGLQAFRGLGWAIDSTITGDILYHSGANQTGFRCYSQFNPATGSGLVILTNGDNGSKVWTTLVEKTGDI